jgi:hypothetical protein
MGLHLVGGRQKQLRKMAGLLRRQHNTRLIAIFLQLREDWLASIIFSDRQI